MTVLTHLKALAIEQLEFVPVWMDSLEPTVQVSGICYFPKEKRQKILSIPSNFSFNGVEERYCIIVYISQGNIGQN